MIIVWDDTCSFCAKWIRVIRALDWTNHIEPIGSSDSAALARLNIRREDADREIQAVDHTRVVGGFDALVAIARQMPATAMFAPLMDLQPIKKVGRRLYRYVATRRHCSLKRG